MTIAPERLDWRAAARADKAAEREQARLDAELRAHLDAEREDRRRRQEREDRRDREEAAERRREQEADRKRQAREERNAARAKAKRERSATRRRWARAVLANGDVTATVVVMLCGMIPAVISQGRGLVHMHMGHLLGTLLPVMLEMSAWAATLGEARALRESRRVWPYRVAVWTSASLAAAINYREGLASYGLTGAVILAASSVGPVALWHMVMAGRHGAKAKRTKTEIAAAKRAAAEEKAKAAHAKARRKHHPKVAEVADRLLSAAPYGSLAAETAWQQAWEAVHGAAAPGMTPELYAAAAAAKHRLGVAFELAPQETEQIRTRLLESFYGPTRTALPKLGHVSALRKKTHKKESGSVSAETASSQAVPQVTPASEKGEKGSRRGNPAGPPVRGRRTPGDTSYSPVARRQMAIAANASTRKAGSR